MHRSADSSPVNATRGELRGKRIAIGSARWTAATRFRTRRPAARSTMRRERRSRLRSVQRTVPSYRFRLLPHELAVADPPRHFLALAVGNLGHAAMFGQTLILHLRLFAAEGAVQHRGGDLEDLHIP